MKRRFKKTAIFMVVIGLVILAISLYFGFRSYQILKEGELVSGTVTDIVRIDGNDGTTYKPEILYKWKGREQFYIPSFSSKSISKKVGDIVWLRVGDKGVVMDGFNGEWISIILGLVFGIIFFVVGLVWFLRHKRNYDMMARLKRYGRRVHARFIKRESTPYQINNQSGNILYLQEENGDRIFQTKPIFSDFSIKWLEEHLFDVYVDTSNPDEYYVDIEKHFGEPQIHK